MPDFIYGTAWKKDKTESMVTMAIESGFRAIDTANQAIHYNEILVGKALKNAKEKGLKRDELWLQSKFTPIDSQGDQLPYDPNSTFANQVYQSFISSLDHLDTNYLDSYLLHGPCNYPGLGNEDFEIWTAIENIYNEKKANSIGVSNFNLEQLKALCKFAKIKPMTVQNRCFANRYWDKDIRNFCLENNIEYQAFSLLTANSEIFNNQKIIDIANKYEIAQTELIFCFSKQIGMTPLTGTCNKEHMIMDLATKNLSLTNNELDIIENIYFSTRF